ncbi:succinate dehydrogenase assembly factor 2 [Zavarzinia sp. CC-PAN008]|uniref:succinate dehydrogenase assembly factor 2 n=1 Tax=Zavarzinia sp. CC-PAN008 TaxID=3243332 RepID=UPI003F743ACA
MATENPSADLAIRRKRLTFRSWHRGFKENDLLLGSFADTHIAQMDEGQLDRYEALLEQPDADIFAWMTGAEAVPAAFDHDVMKLLKDFKFFAQTPWRT